MAKDPAFLFYDADAARDVSHMNRLERGAYFDFMQAQKKFRGITVEQGRKILGKDFNEVWPALELILEVENDQYFIPWMRDSLNKRSKNSEIQRDRIQKYWDDKKIPRNNHGITTDIPYVNENVINSKDIRDIEGIEDYILNSPKSRKTFLPVFEKMMSVFEKRFSGYFKDLDKDFPACETIAQKIEKLKAWPPGSVLNGHLDEFMAFWVEVVDYVAGDDWLSSRSLLDLSTKEWQRLGQHMNKKSLPEKQKKSTEGLSDYQKEIEDKRAKARNKKME